MTTPRTGRRPGPPIRYELTPERHRVVLAVFAEGGTIEEAAAAAGVPRGSFYTTWLVTEPGFHAEVEAARLEHAHRLAAAVERARAGAPEVLPSQPTPAPVPPTPSPDALRRAELAKRAVVPTPAPPAPPKTKAARAVERKPHDTRPTLEAAALAHARARAAETVDLAAWARFPHGPRWPELRQIVHVLSATERDAAALALLLEVQARAEAEAGASLNGHVHVSTENARRKADD